MKIPVLLAAILFSGCAATDHVYVVEPPTQPGVYIKGYDVYPTFHGYELTAGIPALAWIPVVGPYMKELIQLRSGYNRDVVVPILSEKSGQCPTTGPRIYSTRPIRTATPLRPVGVQQARDRWPSAYPEKYSGKR